MRIPTEHNAREQFYRDLIEKCSISLPERKGDYSTLRSWFLFGSGPDESPCIFNKIYPHIDQLTSFLYSAETTRFSINTGASVPEAEQIKIPKMTAALNDEWLNSNADQVFSTALTWSLVYNTTYIKLVVNNGIHPYMIEPGAIGVLREDTPYTDRQEALIQTYYITKSELYSRLYSHPKRDQIVKRVSTNVHSITDDIPEGLDRIVMSQTNPTLYGTVNLDLYGMNRYKARVAEDTVKMTELWAWNDETKDYQVVTMADPDIIIYDRPGASVFLRGELPFVQICPNPQYDYYWGQSENMESTSWITSNNSGGICGARRSALALGISDASSPPARLRAKFFSSSMPVKPVRVVGGLTCLESKSKISVMRLFLSCCKKTRR